MAWFIQPLIYLALFFGFVLIFQVVVNWFLTSREGRRRVNRRVDMLGAGLSREEVYDRLVRNPGGLKFSDQRLASLYDRFSNHLRQAGLRISPQRFIGFVALWALADWVVSLFVLPSVARGFAVNAMASLCGSILLATASAWAFLGARRRKRLKQLEEQLPLALDIINRALRAGHPVVSAVQLAATEMSDPIGSEFGLIIDETTYGAEFQQALANFAGRTGSSDVYFFAVSVSIQSETGGNLAEILEALALVIRGRITLGKRVRALASEARATTTLLSALPVLLVGFFALTLPNYYTSKFSDPIFWPTMSCVAVLYCIGLLVFRRIVNFKY